MGTIKPCDELSFQDDYIFKRVMSHKRFCKRMLEKILRIEIRDIRYLEEEQTSLQNHGNPTMWYLVESQKGDKTGNCSGERDETS